jgi:hypothetical protein
MEQREVPEEPPTRPGSPSNSSVAVAVLLMGLAILGLAYVRERQHVAKLAAENSQIAATLSQTQSQLDTLMTRVNAMTLREVEVSSPATLSSQPQAQDTRPFVSRKTMQRTRAPRLVERERWKKVEDQLAEQRKAITGTREDLETARTDLATKLSSAQEELNGSIARTHYELVALEQKGERNYYEFDLEKSKQFQHVGPLSLSLRKTNTKHEYFDMALVVDDRKLNKKHVNLYEPLLVYPAATRRPFEVIVNQITRKGAHGYVSSPRYPEPPDTASGAVGTAAPHINADDANRATASGGSSRIENSLSHRQTAPL